ncbi:MAG TPA: hypothetical protein VFZ09_50120 [Archangium sp.]|uniref:hypothetical protein n=1 Tax=Archangium sp. TaxID=1872627 RepID=UPI002E32E337|nr:hypothetical protein [Archangium sp.]HEX5754441.1 hypothetical protein [Archangium sp.]
MVPPPRCCLPRSWLLVGLVLWEANGQTGCTDRNSVVGRITPEHFWFKTTVERSDAQPGGWQAVCIHARITEGDSGATTVCKFEVGLPLRNGQREIPLWVARRDAAEMANRAAYKVLSNAPRGEMMFTLCSNFKTLYDLMLREKHPGALVGACVSEGIETVLFDIPRPSKS